MIILHTTPSLVQHNQVSQALQRQGVGTRPRGAHPSSALQERPPLLPPSLLQASRHARTAPKPKKSKWTRGAQAAHSAAAAAWWRVRDVGVCVCMGAWGRLRLGGGHRNASAADAVLSRRGKGVPPSCTQTARHTGTHTAPRPHTEHTDATWRGQAQAQVSLLRARRRCRTRLSWAEGSVFLHLPRPHHTHPGPGQKGRGGHGVAVQAVDDAAGWVSWLRGPTFGGSWGVGSRAAAGQVDFALASASVSRSSCCHMESWGGGVCCCVSRVCACTGLTD